MTDHWDTMIEKDDAELVAEIRADIVWYESHTLSGNKAAALAIEQKYGFLGLSPQEVATQLAEMARPIGGVA